ncbi:cupin domain-containing protein [Sinorhizobium sp. 8-89]|uniref:cupin domain-containing protein n=1 Tax=Sinorhizobium sp. 7-81 TaxID=3049087 RepID=UPI0024C27858|nr:cupin domain-containing protein [Sinorhizobium sp. 7-81]MDK1386549.1 cupin domain-containing protein [Sinorhizobium sp. 7-81]
MLINDDLSKPVIVHGSRLEWIPSPAVGVDRRMLFRIGDEKARATSIVRYAPGSAFPQHTHGGGEEFVVLEGVFQDEHGDYPAGSYIRNPPGTSHVPASADGCTIFVRLWQFRAEDRNQIVRRPGEGDAGAPHPGVKEALILFEDGHEEVGIETWMPGKDVKVENADGLEFLVLSGEVVVGGEFLERQAWGRLPARVPLHASVGKSGARVWIKRGPLMHPDVCQF